MVGDGTVRRYVDFVDSGVSLDDLPDNLVLEDPRAGRIEGRRELSRSWRVSSRWLAERDARIEWVASTVGEARAVGELVIHLTLEQMSLSLPIARRGGRGRDAASAQEAEEGNLGRRHHGAFGHRSRSTAGLTRFAQRSTSTLIKGAISMARWRPSRCEGPNRQPNRRRRRPAPLTERRSRAIAARRRQF